MLRPFIFASLLFLGLSCLELTEQQRKILSKHGSACEEETGATMELINKLLKGEREHDEENLTKIKAQCACLFKKLGLVNDNGHLTNDKFKSRIKAAANNDDEAEKIATKCLVNKDTPEDSTYEVTLCLYQKLPDFVPVD